MTLCRVNFKKWKWNEASDSSCNPTNGQPRVNIHAGKGGKAASEHQERNEASMSANSGLTVGFGAAEALRSGAFLAQKNL